MAGVSCWDSFCGGFIGKGDKCDYKMILKGKKWRKMRTLALKKSVGDRDGKKKEDL